MHRLGYNHRRHSYTSLERVNSEASAVVKRENTGKKTLSAGTSSNKRSPARPQLRRPIATDDTMVIARSRDCHRWSHPKCTDTTFATSRVSTTTTSSAAAGAIVTEDSDASCGSLIHLTIEVDAPLMGQ